MSVFEYALVRKGSGEAISKARLASHDAAVLFFASRKNLTIDGFLDLFEVVCVSEERTATAYSST